MSLTYRYILQLTNGITSELNVTNRLIAIRSGLLEYLVSLTETLLFTPANWASVADWHTAIYSSWLPFKSVLLTG